MGNQILAAFIICVPFFVKGFPLSDTFNEVLEPRDIISDYVTSWFWSPASIEEPSEDDESKVTGKSNVRLDEKAEKPENDIKNMPIELTSKKLQDFSIPGKIKPLQKISNSVQTEDIENLLETIKEEVQDSDNDEKLGTFNFLQKLKDTITTNPAPYVEVVYKKVKHFVNIGTLGDSKRVRCFESFESYGTPWWLGFLQLFYGLFGMFGQPAQTVATNQAPVNNNWQTGLFGPNPALQRAQSQVQLTAAPPSQLNLFGQIDPNSQTISRTVNPNVNFQGVNPFGNLTALMSQQNPSLDNTNILMLLLLLANQMKGNGNIPNNDIMKIVAHLQDNPNNSNIDVSKILTSLQGNPNSSNTDITKLLAPLLRKSTNNPNSDTSIKDVIPRVFIVNDNPKDLNLDLDDSTKIYQIIGSPDERLRKIRSNYLRNPDASQKVIIIDELNRLLNETDRNSTLYPKIIELYDKIREDPRYKTAISIDRSNGGNGPRSFENIVFLDDKGNRIARESLSDDFVQRILNRISGSMKNNQIRTFDNPEALRKYQFTFILNNPINEDNN